MVKLGSAVEVVAKDGMTSRGETLLAGWVSEVQGGWVLVIDAKGRYHRVPRGLVRAA